MTDELAAFIDDVDELLTLNESIRMRLGMDIGWTPEMIAQHAQEVDDRKILEHSLAATARTLKEVHIYVEGMKWLDTL